MKSILYTSLYFLALMNPVSKIFILSTLANELSLKERKIVVIKSSIIAFLILFVFILTQDIIFTKIFKINLYSLKIAGGIILTYIGFKAINKGIFFETSANNKLVDISIVPLASPMIAGPATITACIIYSKDIGLKITFFSIVIAIIINLFIMVLSDYISKFLLKYNLMGALIRITGLIVMAMAIQMISSGLIDLIKIIK